MEMIGHKKIISFLDRSIKKNMISQAYLFSGPEHVGKFTVAMDFAKKIAGGKDQKINPDIIVVSPEVEEKKGRTRKKDIKVEQIRELERQFSLSPYFGKHKVAIIDDADRLTISSQNALLKTLEDALPGRVLILISHNQDKILPTIRSRCFIKKFNLVKNSELSGIIGHEKNKEDLLFWSFGRPGFTRDMEDPRVFSEKKETEKEFVKLLGDNLNDRFFLAENLAKNSEGLVEKLELWMAMLRQNILSERKFFIMDSRKALDLIEEISEAQNLLRGTNSNPRAVLEKLFLKV